MAAAVLSPITTRLRPTTRRNTRAAADETDAGDGPGQHVRRAVRGDDADHAGPGTDQREHPVTGQRPAQSPLEAERVGQAGRGREVRGVGAAQGQAHGSFHGR